MHTLDSVSIQLVSFYIENFNLFSTVSKHILHKTKYIYKNLIKYRSQSHILSQK